MDGLFVCVVRRRTVTTTDCMYEHGHTFTHAHFQFLKMAACTSEASPGESCRALICSARVTISIAATRASGGSPALLGVRRMAWWCVFEWVGFDFDSVWFEQ